MKLVVLPSSVLRSVGIEWFVVIQIVMAVVLNNVPIGVLTSIEVEVVPIEKTAIVCCFFFILHVCDCRKK